MGRTLEQIIWEATDTYAEALAPDDHPAPEYIEKDLERLIETDVLIENQFRAKGTGYRVPTHLSPAQIVRIMLKIYPIVKIRLCDSSSDYDLLAMYQTDGEDEGIYVTNEDKIRSLTKKFYRSAGKYFLDEVIADLSLMAPQVKRTVDKDLIAVNNGIFSFSTKELLPFDPQYVFVAKSKVNFNPNARNVTIHNDTDNTDWDVESWMAGLSDDPDVVKLLWEILSAIIRPHVRWRKSV